MWNQVWHWLSAGITPDAIFIVVVLIIFEIIVFSIDWYIGAKQSKELYSLLEDLVTTLALKEQKEEEKEVK